MHKGGRVQRYKGVRAGARAVRLGGCKGTRSGGCKGKRVQGVKEHKGGKAQGT